VSPIKENEEEEGIEDFIQGQNIKIVDPPPLPPSKTAKKVTKKTTVKEKDKKEEARK